LVELVKRFETFTAVDGITLTIPGGTFFSLLGPSGCGKTTTLRMVAGFEQPTSGEVVLDGVDMAGTPPNKRNVNTVFQSYALFPHLTVFDNVAFDLRRAKVDRPHIKKRVSDILDQVQLSKFASRKPAQLSGGQQQRVALARAIVIEPEVLLLDEPLSNLDANLREEMRFEIRRLHDEFKITTVYVTHDQTEAMVTSDRIAVMNQGRIEQIDKPHALYNRPTTRFVASFIGRTNVVEGVCDGNLIVFDRFAVPTALIAGGAILVGKATFSIRPHGMRLLRHRPDSSAASVEVSVLERAYLGEHWDYIVAPREGTLRLKVAAPPLNEFEKGDTAWLDFDTRQIALIT
jgi:iron(III) transport system ATP-binding protein